jgi:DNA processing protein
MGEASTDRFLAIRPEELLGPLNEVETKNAPKLLFLEGHREVIGAGPRVAVIGSRKATQEGLRRTRRLARELSQNGVTIVSGLAAGVDTAAHRSALEAGGRTIAVIGTPLDQAYPSSNRQLQGLLAEQHLVVSQFAVGTATQPRNFPQRNRTMALISHASVIVEAGESSGSLSQGWEALRLGRPLFLLRSIVDDPNLQWPAKMLDYGASVLTAVEDLLDVIPSGTASERFDAAAF